MTNHFKQAKKRTLSEEEAEWIDDATEAAESCNYAIQGLSEMLIAISEMMYDEKIDNLYKNELCRNGTMAIAYGIKGLCERVADRQEYVKDVLIGKAAAEQRGRSEWAKDIISRRNCKPL